jgi:hypothetical protein
MGSTLDYTDSDTGAQACVAQGLKRQYLACNFFDGIDAFRRVDTCMSRPSNGLDREPAGSLARRFQNAPR